MRRKCPICDFELEIDLRRQRRVVCGGCGKAYALLEFERLANRRKELEHLAEYHVEHYLGSGEFADVFAAVDRQSQRRVALKLPRDNSFEQRSYVRREHAAANRLDHPNIIKISRLVDDNPPYLVCQLVEGKSLSDLIKKREIDQKAAVELCATLAEAMHYAHERGVVHRDLKPSNILIDDQGRPHITDFGMARCEFDTALMSSERYREAFFRQAGGRPNSSFKMGTPAYMAPEQVRGEQAGPHSDVYSLGVILYELLTDVRPFHGDAKVVMKKVLRDEPLPPRRLKATIPRDLEAVCLKALAKKVSRRYESAKLLAEDCRRVARSEPIQIQDPRPLDRLLDWVWRHPWEVCALLFIIAAFAILLSWLARLDTVALQL